MEGEMFEELQRLIAQAILAGASLDRIEEEIIDRSALDDEQRAVLWLRKRCEDATASPCWRIARLSYVRRKLTVHAIGNHNDRERGSVRFRER